MMQRGAAAKAKTGGKPPRQASSDAQGAQKAGAQRIDLNILGATYMKELKDRCGCLQVVCVRGMNNKASRFGPWKLKRGGLLERVLCGWEHQRGCREKWRHKNDKMNDYP